MEMKDKIMDLPIASIRISDWDVRKNADNPEDFQALKVSISMDGLLHPITVLQANDGKYTLIAGRRRLRACKELGMKTVPVFVKEQILDEKLENRKTTVIENLHRRELTDTERSYGIMAIYQSAGYSPEDAISGVKSLDNWFHHNPGKGWSKLSGEDSSPLRGFKANPLRYDRKFQDICRSIGFTPKYQYQVLQLTRDLPEDILAAADRLGLTFDKKVMLTHTKLREHPKLQRSLVNRLATKPNVVDAHMEVSQTIHDLQTGYMQPDETKQIYTVGHTEHDKVQRKPRKEMYPSDYIQPIKREIFGKMLPYLTGHKLTKGEYKYTKDMIEVTKTHRLNMVKGLQDYRELNGFLTMFLEPLKWAIEDTIKLVEKEMQTIDKKEGMMSQ